MAFAMMSPAIDLNNFMSNQGLKSTCASRRFEYIYC